MKKYTVERCLSGYIIWKGEPCGFGSDASNHVLAFSHKEHVLDYLRKALNFDKETGLAKENSK